MKPALDGAIDDDDEKERERERERERDGGVEESVLFVIDGGMQWPM